MGDGEFPLQREVHRVLADHGALTKILQRRRVEIPEWSLVLQHPSLITRGSGGQGFVVQPLVVRRGGGHRASPGSPAACADRNAGNGTRRGNARDAAAGTQRPESGNSSGAGLVFSQEGDENTAALRIAETRCHHARRRLGARLALQLRESAGRVLAVRAGGVGGGGTNVSAAEVHSDPVRRVARVTQFRASPIILPTRSNSAFGVEATSEAAAFSGVGEPKRSVTSLGAHISAASDKAGPTRPAALPPVRPHLLLPPDDGDFGVTLLDGTVTGASPDTPGTDERGQSSKLFSSNELGGSSHGLRKQQSSFFRFTQPDDIDRPREQTSLPLVNFAVASATSSEVRPSVAFPFLPPLRDGCVDSPFGAPTKGRKQGSPLDGNRSSDSDGEGRKGSSDRPSLLLTNSGGPVARALRRKTMELCTFVASDGDRTRGPSVSSEQPFGTSMFSPRRDSTTYQFSSGRNSAADANAGRESLSVASPTTGARHAGATSVGGAAAALRGVHRLLRLAEGGGGQRGARGARPPRRKRRASRDGNGGGGSDGDDDGDASDDGSGAKNASLGAAANSQAPGALALRPEGEVRGLAVRALQPGYVGPVAAKATVERLSAVASHQQFLLALRGGADGFFGRCDRALERQQSDRRVKYRKKYAALDIGGEPLPFRATPAAVLHHVERVITLDERQSHREEEFTRELSGFNAVRAHCEECYRHPQVTALLSSAATLIAIDRPSPSPALYFAHVFSVLAPADLLFHDVMAASLHLATLFGVPHPEVVAAARSKANRFVAARIADLDKTLTPIMLASMVHGGGGHPPSGQPVVAVTAAPPTVPPSGHLAASPHGSGVGFLQPSHLQAAALAPSGSFLMPGLTPVASSMRYLTAERGDVADA